MDDLVDEAHQWVDDRRRELGLVPWKWHKPKQHRVRQPLEDLITNISITTTTTEENNDMLRDYSCKHSGCSFVGQSTVGTGSLHEHYQAHPDHKKQYVPKSQRGAPVSHVGRPRVNGSVGRALSAFEQLHDLQDKFAAEIKQEMDQIHSMRAEIEARESRLSQLRSTHTVLYNAINVQPPSKSDVAADLGERSMEDFMTMPKPVE